MQMFLKANVIAVIAQDPALHRDAHHGLGSPDAPPGQQLANSSRVSQSACNMLLWCTTGLQGGAKAQAAVRAFSSHPYLLTCSFLGAKLSLRLFLLGSFILADQLNGLGVCDPIWSDNEHSVPGLR